MPAATRSLPKAPWQGMIKMLRSLPISSSTKPQPRTLILRKHTSILELSSPSSSHNRPRSSATLCTLPTELLLLIIFNLDRVTSTCLGLTSYRFYLIHFSVNGKVGWKENTIYTMELDQGPWASGGNLGFGILGPMTVVRSSTLGDMLEGRAGGREWDGRLRYFRPMEKVVEGGIEEGKSGVEESEKIENSRVVDIEEEKNEIGDIEREGNESEQIEGEETEGDEISDSEGYETAPEQTEETEETDIATEDKKRKSETIDSAEAKKARLAQRKILEDEERYNVGTLEFIESQILVLDGRAVKDDCTARARKMLIEAGSIFSTGEKPSLWALERASELTIRAVVLARK